MRAVELALAAIPAALGVRSLVYWSRRPLESTVLSDHLLYALFLTGRIGFWFSLSGIFLISALVDVEGRAFVDEMQQFRWYAAIPLGLAALQLVAGVLLGRSSEPDQ